MRDVVDGRKAELFEAGGAAYVDGPLRTRTAALVAANLPIVAALAAVGADLDRAILEGPSRQH